MTESETQRQILKYLEINPKVVIAVRVNSGGHRGRMRGAPKGTPDILGQLKNGCFLAIEVKDGKKEATPKQQEFLDKVNNNGGLAFVARSLEDVEAKL